MSHEQFTHQEKAAVAAIIGKVHGLRDVVRFGNALLEISKNFRKLNLQEIEAMLRDMGSPIYLIALPIEIFPDYEARLPHAAERQFPYGLYAVVNGFGEAEAFMEKHRLSTELNFQRLASTGMLTSSSGPRRTDKTTTFPESETKPRDYVTYGWFGGRKPSRITIMDPHSNVLLVDIPVGHMSDGLIMGTDGQTIGSYERVIDYQPMDGVALSHYNSMRIYPNDPAQFAGVLVSESSSK